MKDRQLSRDVKLCTRWALGLTIALIVVWPGTMFLTGYDYSLQFFKGWTYLALGWLIVAGLFIIVRPLIDFYKEGKR
ncbi:MAG TPA: hypothetical protein VEY51_08855 [Chondromyces sp.]|nr:hypothetical protein [Chondromyces sp.]